MEDCEWPHSALSEIKADLERESRDRERELNCVKQEAAKWNEKVKAAEKVHLNSVWKVQRTKELMALKDAGVESSRKYLKYSRLEYSADGILGDNHAQVFCDFSGFNRDEIEIRNSQADGYNNLVLRFEARGPISVLRNRVSEITAIPNPKYIQYHEFSYLKIPLPVPNGDFRVIDTTQNHALFVSCGFCYVLNYRTAEIVSKVPMQKGKCVRLVGNACEFRDVTQGFQLLDHSPLVYATQETCGLKIVKLLNVFTGMIVFVRYDGKNPLSMQSAGFSAAYDSYLIRFGDWAPVKISKSLLELKARL